MNIKFNAWDKFEKRMILWDDMIKDKESEKLIPEILLNSERYIPLLFTGVVLENGDEVFHKDILDNLVVSYAGNMQECLGMETGWYLERDNFESYTPLVCGDYYKKQGNIYEGLKIDL